MATNCGVFSISPQSARSKKLVVILFDWAKNSGSCRLSAARFPRRPPCGSAPQRCRRGPKCDRADGRLRRHVSPIGQRAGLAECKVQGGRAGDRPLAIPAGPTGRSRSPSPNAPRAPAAAGASPRAAGPARAGFRCTESHAVTRSAPLRPAMCCALRRPPKRGPRRRCRRLNRPVQAPSSQPLPATRFACGVSRTR